MNRYDVIIIGSGAGGGTVLEYLSRQGMKVLLLERGPYWPKEAFTQREIEMSKLYFNRGAVLSVDRTIGLAAGRTLGGSTAVYTGVSFRPPPDVLQNWRDEFGLQFLTDDYANGVLDEIEEQIGVHELPPQMDNDNNTLFRAGCEELDIQVKRLRINTRNCGEQGFCNLGCTRGAKQGTLEVQIPLAMQRGAEVVWNAFVHEVEPGELPRVRFRVDAAAPWTKPNEWVGGEHTVEGKIVVVAAGTLNTPALLGRSGKLKLNRTLLGRYVTLHPACNVNGIYRDPLKNYRGFPKTYYVDAFSDSQHYFLETSFYYPGVTAKNNPGFGTAHQSLMDDYRKMMSILILTHDEAEKQNRIGISRSGEPELHYTVSDSVKASLVHALRKSAEIFFAAGCEKVALPGSLKPVVTRVDMKDLERLIDVSHLDLQKSPLSSAHPQGGARMASDASKGIISPSGHLFEHANIFVADASLFPTSVKVNPYETVMLMARYVAERVMSANGIARVV